jgi:acyl-coenzyme A synthetase/AMP-(fatty) acid ligase
MLFFSGRNDDLIKLHAYRIELNEITATINKLTYVEQAAAIALKPNGSVKKIVSLIKLKPAFENKITVYKLKNDIGKTLPSCMITSGFKFVADIPLNQNGKTDKNLLTNIFLGK